MAHLPSGTIVLWFGAIVNIPAGFIYCDGTQGTPDLRDRFIIGASAVFPPGLQAGSIQHNHDFVTNGHDHFLPAGVTIAGGGGRTDDTNVEVDTGTTDNSTSLPPYHALAYIMKT